MIPKHKVLRVTFWQFEAALEEHVTRATLWDHRSEVFALYCAGFSVEQVAGELRETTMQENLP